MPKQRDRLHRQFAAVARSVPATRGAIDALLHGRMRLVRLPLACLLIAGSILAILPVFGLWMLPLGLMLLAVDIPALRPVISSLLIRARRRISVWRHRGTRD